MGEQLTPRIDIAQLEHRVFVHPRVFVLVVHLADLERLDLLVLALGAERVAQQPGAVQCANRALELPEHGHRLEELFVGAVGATKHLQDRILAALDQVPNGMDVGFLELFEELLGSFGVAHLELARLVVEFAGRLEEILRGSRKATHGGLVGEPPYQRSSLPGSQKLYASGWTVLHVGQVRRSGSALNSATAPASASQ